MFEAPQKHQQVWLIKDIGPEAEDAVLPLLENKDARARQNACEALRSIGTKKSFPALQKATRDRDGSVAVAAMDALRVLSGERPDYTSAPGARTNAFLPTR